MSDIKRICKLTGEEFIITDEDQDFYKRVGVPMPTLCPSARRLRRLAFRNERTLYQRKCTLTGENILSNFSADKPYKVYKHDEWWKDSMDPMEYGRDYDFNRPFFEQYDELMHDVPFIHLLVIDSENSNFTNHSWYAKNCYLLFDAGHNENLLYCDTMYFDKFCTDCFHCPKECELCYECIDCETCYNCNFAQQCHGSSDMNFCFDCNGCQNCCMCFNLRNKKFCFKNKQYSQEEYEKLVKALELGSYENCDKFKKEFWDFKTKEAIHHFSASLNIQNCTGAFLTNCKNCHDCYDIGLSEDCKYLFDGGEPCGKNFYDDDRSGWDAELSYDSLGNATPYFSKFVISCAYPKSTQYCMYCHNPIDCFGCLGLKKGQHVILNKQYSKQEYDEILPRIIEHMKSTGEYGEFFPMNISPFCYNETLAYDYFPLTKEQILGFGLKWKEPDKKEYVPSAYKIPDNIKDVDDGILKEVLACEKSGKNYKIQKQELEFYRKKNLPIPRLCPDERYKNRIAIRPPYKLWDRTCTKTGKPIKSCYDPARPEKVYCEEAYLEAIY